MCVWAGGDACVRVFASGARFWKDQGRRCSGKGPGKECVRFLRRVGNVQGRAAGSAGQARNVCVRKGTCSLSDTEGNAKVFAFVSMGADTKANTLRRRRTRGSRSWSTEGFPRA